MVIATGPYQKPLIPPASDGLGSVFQIAANTYRNPGQLPAGAVLVVGAGASGCQIAEELHQAGRTVFLSVGPHRRAPRRYRGQDVIWWITAMGMDDRIADEAASRRAPLLISGAGGGRTVDLRRFAAEGMLLLGRLIDARDGVASFSDDLASNLAAGDETYEAFIRAADAHVAQHGLALPADSEPGPNYPEPRSVLDPIGTLDLAAAGIGAAIWATGYSYAFDWIDLDIFEGPQRRPAHRRGVTSVPGAYFLGLPMLHKSKSSFLSGVGEDADYLADQIAARI